MAGKGQQMGLRDVEPGDVSAYVRMRCDPVMMAELGGPLPREGIDEKVDRDVQAAAAGTRLVKKMVPRKAAPAVGGGEEGVWGARRRGGGAAAWRGWVRPRRVAGARAAA